MDGPDTPAPRATVREAQQLEEEFLNQELSGLFTVPTVTLPLTMHIYVSSHISTAESVQFQVNQFTESGKRTVFRTALVIPALGATDTELDLGSLDLRGAILEVLFESPDPMQVFQLMPSVDIVETFPADGATLPLMFIPPANFSQVFPGEDGGEPAPAGADTGRALQEFPPIRSTTGIFDVPQGVAAVRPRVRVLLSSFSDESLTAVVEVNRLVRGTTGKELVLRETITVPANEERELVVENVEGLPIEVNLTLSRDAKGNALLPSVDVTRVFTSTDTVESVLLIPAGQFQGIFTEEAE